MKPLSYTMSFSEKKMMPLKVIMSLLIVAHHLSYYNDAIWLRPFHSLGAPIVSVFFFISGYGLFASYKRIGQDYFRGFFVRKTARIIIPALMSLAFYFLILWKHGRGLLNGIQASVLCGHLIIPSHWFVVAILYFYIIFLLCFRYLSGKSSCAALLAGTLLYIVAAILLGYDRCWWISALSFPTGVLFARREMEIYSFCKAGSHRYIILLCILTLSFVGLYLTRKPYLWTLCYILFPFIVALIVARLPLERMCVAPISYLFLVFYEVYLCQEIPMVFFTERVPVNSVVLYVVLVYMTTIALAFVVRTLSHLILNRYAHRI